MFRHIVLFRVRDDVTGPVLSAAIDELRALGEVAAANEWRVELSLDERKGRVVVEDATFASRSEFEAFRGLEPHRAAGRTMADISDWYVGDYEADSAS